MPSHQPRQIVIDFLKASFAGDIDTALALIDESFDLVSHAPVQFFPHLGHRKGKEQLRQTWAMISDRYAVRRHEILQIVAEGDEVAAIVKALLTKHGSKRIVRIDSANFFTLRDGLIATQQQFVDSFDMMEQVLERDLSDLLTVTAGT